MQSAVGVTFKKLLNYGLCLQNCRTLSGAINSLSQGCQCQSFLQSNSTEKSSHRYVHKLRLARSSALLSGFQIGRTGHWNVKLCIDGPTGRKVWVRFLSTPEKEAEGDRQRGKSVFIYTSAIVIFMVGMTYAGVPLYRIFCQATGLGGKAVAGHDDGKVETMVPVQNRIIRVRFNADVASSMKWNFRPQQSEVRVFPGETALAFYTAKNPTNKAIIGISTYNVVPFEAGQYFNKIQCFCFEEQRLNPKEEVDMPVFFYIDPEFAEDPKMEKVETITLSYTFFEAKEGLNLPLPGYATQ